MVNTFPQVVTIAGSDSDGSAGMEADLHTFFMRHTYGMAIVTACVAGNSYGIQDSVDLPLSFVKQEFKSLADDFKICASKTGMLSNASLIATVAQEYQKYSFGPLVVDPVIVTKHGATLLSPDALHNLRNLMLPLATVITPNFYEAQALVERQLQTKDDIKKAAQELQKMGAKNIMIKGRHDNDQQADVADYVLLASGEDFWLSSPYVKTEHVNGTGDSLSACITAELGKGKTITTAIKIAKKFVYQAIAHQIDVGHKYGPINHWATADIE